MEFEHKGRLYYLSGAVEVTEEGLRIELSLMEQNNVVATEHHLLGSMEHCCPHCAMNLFDKKEKIFLSINGVLSNVREGIILVKLRDKCTLNKTVGAQLNFKLKSKLTLIKS